jgi:hypothetical protein
VFPFTYPDPGEVIAMLVIAPTPLVVAVPVAGVTTPAPVMVTANVVKVA